MYLQHFPLKPVTEHQRAKGLSCGVCLKYFKENQLVFELPCKVSVADTGASSVYEKCYNQNLCYDKFYSQHRFHRWCIQNGFDVRPACRTCRQTAGVNDGAPVDPTDPAIDQAKPVIAIRNFWVCGNDDNLIIEGDMRNGKFNR